MGNFLKTILIIFVLFFIGSNLALAASIDVACINYNYPWCGKNAPTGIADLVGKFYGYALAAVGVAALGAIIYGGILHTVSAGNASQQSEAKAWIWGAVTGVALLLGAYLLLNTINPELTKLTDPIIEKQTIKSEQATSTNQNQMYYAYKLNDVGCSAGWIQVSDGECSSRNRPRPSRPGYPNAPVICCKFIP